MIKEIWIEKGDETRRERERLTRGETRHESRRERERERRKAIAALCMSHREERTKHGANMRLLRRRRNASSGMQVNRENRLLTPWLLSVFATTIEMPFVVVRTVE